MAHRATIWQDKGGRGVYLHHGNPKDAGPILAKFYNTDEKVTALLDLAHENRGYLSSLGKTLDECDLVTVTEDDAGFLWKNVEFPSERAEISDTNGPCEHYYEWNGRLWYCTNIARGNEWPILV